MPSTIALQMPSEVPHAARMKLDELRTELAVYLFQQGRLSFGKARQVAGMTLWQFQQLLGSRGISPHYDVEDYEEDLVTLRRRTQP